MVKERVELRLRFRTDKDLPPGEWLWAERVRANHRGGAYRLLNSSAFCHLTQRGTLLGHFTRE